MSSKTKPASDAQPPAQPIELTAAAPKVGRARSNCFSNFRASPLAGFRLDSTACPLLPQTTMPNLSHITPGTRIRARGEDWMVNKVDRSPTGSRCLTVTGLGALVRNRQALFLEDLEDDLEIIDPRNTIPVSDASPFFRDTRLHLEFLLRQAAPPDARIHLGHLGAMDMVPYQIDPAHLALQQPRQRILIADSVGLGKTIECGVLLSELIRRGRARRILVLTVKSMLTQFQKELWGRFTIPLVRLDSVALQRVRTEIPANHNPFHYFDKTIVSIDTIKQDGEYRRHLEDAWWDVIVIDEAHNVAQRSGNSLRHRVADLLSSRSDSLILLSATPHDGRKESFASIMNMLNPTAIKDEKNYGPDDIEGLFIRRFKKDIKDQVRGAFPERVTSVHRVSCSPAEELAHAALSDLELPATDENRGGKLLFRVLLEKALFSSPAACTETIDQRLKNIAQTTDPSRYAADASGLRSLRESVAAIHSADFSKYQQLLVLLRANGRSALGWSPADGADRLVIFTERIATLHWLRHHLPTDLGLKEAQIAILHGGLSDIEQQDIVEQFGNESSKLRLLIASDVASEGINLHYLSHRLVHFDIPWSLLTFQQRNGRVDRYGQARQPEIHYLLTESTHEKIRGDLRILEILIRKDEQVQQNIGDPSEFTGIHSSEEEELEVGRYIESGTSPEAFDAAFGSTNHTETDDPFLAALLGEIAPPITARDGMVNLIASDPSLFPNEYHWAKAALGFVRDRLDRKMDVEFLDERREIHLQLPDDLIRRLKRQPREIRPDDGQWILTDRREAVMKEIADCRKEEGRWPQVQLLWPLHPLMTWLEDKLLSAFGRAEAPVIHVPTLSAGVSIVLASGTIPNRKGHPLIQRWIGAVFQNGKLSETIDLPEVLARTGFDQTQFPNPGKAITPTALQTLIPATVEATRKVLSEAKKSFDTQNQPELQRQLAKLESFRHARESQLELRFEKMEHVRNAEKRKVSDLYHDYSTWIKDTMETEDSPDIRIAAVFTTSH